MKHEGARGAPPSWESYDPSENPSQVLFHSAPLIHPYGKLVKGAVGGLGGGKSTACENEQIDICLKTPEGVSIAIRESMPKAEPSLLEDYHVMLRGLAEWDSRTSSFTLPNRHRLIIAPGDRWDRFGSTQFVTAYAMEAQEIHWRIISTLSERLRHPAGMQQGVPWYRLLFDARGVESQHWVNQEFRLKAWDPRKGWDARLRAKNPFYVYVKFTSFDNKKHLRPGYIEELLDEHKHDPTWIKMMIWGEIGYYLDGRPVFGDSYSEEVHVARIEADPTLPLLRGWDFGYNAPAVVWFQYSRDGRLLALREFCPREISRDRLVDEAIALERIEFPEHHASQVRDFGDIAGDSANPTGVTDIEYVEQRLATSFEGLQKPPIEHGLNILRQMMKTTRMLDGKLRPCFMVDERCEILREALRGLYYYEKRASLSGAVVKEKPVKSTTYAATIDCCRYVAQSVLGEEDDVSYSGAGSGSISFANY